MLEKTGVSLGQVDQVEINEAFAAQVDLHSSNSIIERLLTRK